MSDPKLHPALDAMAFLVGTWTGAGTGDYPTIEPFHYREELRFWHVGKPFLAYTQRTWDLDGAPLHSEMGYWRATDDGVELVLAHPNGLAEIATGTLVKDGAGGVVDLSTVFVGQSPTAKSVTALRRRYAFDGEALRCDLWMAAVEQQMTHHLRATLRRVDL